MCERCHALNFLAMRGQMLTGPEGDELLNDLALEGLAHRAEILGAVNYTPTVAGLVRAGYTIQ